MENIIESNRGKKQLILNNFKFRIGSSNKGLIRWWCTTKNCTAKVYTDENNICINNTDTPQHNHGEYSCQALKKQVLNTACKRKAIENVSTRPKKIILTEIAQNSNSSDITINDINRIRKNIYENRRKIMPPNPTNIVDAHNALNSIDVKTKQSENFLLVNDEKENIIIFSCCETNLLFLSTVYNIYMDGTFDCSTRFFLQFFSIHGYLNGYYVPLVFLLITK